MTTIKEELTAVASEYGSLSGQAIVEWADAHPGSELHKLLKWEDVEAATATHRLYEARWLIATRSAL